MYECTNFIFANLCDFHQNVGFYPQFPFCLKHTSEAIKKNWLILCCLLFNSAFSLCFKLWQLKFYGKRGKGFEFGVWRKMTKLKEVVRNAIAIQMWVGVCPRHGRQPKLWSWHQDSCWKVLCLSSSHLIGRLHEVSARHAGCYPEFSYWALKDN